MSGSTVTLSGPSGTVAVAFAGRRPAQSYSATVAALKEAIPLLKARGLELVTVDQLLGEKPYA